MEQKDNTGVFFKNDHKTTDNHPDYKGNCIVEGVKKEMGMWLNTSKSGVTYFSVAFTKPFVKDAPPKPVNTINSKKPPVVDDDLPF
jgi:uncharacterized protein (DUF736 family)